MRYQKLSRELGYRFLDERLLEQALTHSSARARNNERMEFVGDAILGFVIAEHLYQRFPGLPEGEMTRLRASLVKQDSLAQIARDIELGQYLQLGMGELKSGGFSRDSILANALEALFCAVYLDGGLPASSGIILRLFARRLDSLDLEMDSKDPKTRLQELLQADGRELPSYRVTAIGEESGAPVFEVECLAAGLHCPAVGKGPSRKKAEQFAAALALGALQAKGNQ